MQHRFGGTTTTNNNISRSRIGKMSFSQLRSISHDQPAYKAAWEQRGTSNRHPMSFEDFFEDDPDALVGVKESMIEDAMLRQRFPEPCFD